MLHKLFPKEFNFFDLFEKQAGFTVDAAKCFRKIVSGGAIDAESLKKIKDIEHQGDETAHEIIHQLDKSFITPFDREDIYSLTTELDDVIDMINTIVSRMKIYKLSGANKYLMEFSRIIEESVNAIDCVIKGLRNSKNTKIISDACVEINRLENIGDTMRDEALEELFDKEKDPIAVIKWKEIYQDAETVLDICEDVAHVVSSLMVKQA